MSQRANLLLIEDNRYRLFYCHWCANTLPHDVFWGPEYAIPFVTQQRAVNESDWQNELWAEGGVVIDLSRRVLLVFGGEDIMYDIPLRRLYLGLLREIWTDWDVRWAYNGILDIADYVGHPREDLKVREYSDTMPQTVSLEPSNLTWSCRSVGSFLLADGRLRMFPLREHAKWYLRMGPAILEAAEAEVGSEALHLEQRIKRIPVSGFHIDVANRQLAYWDASERDRIEIIAPQWVGWKVEWLRDNFEYQLARTRNQLTFPSNSDNELLSELELILLGDSRSGGPGLIQDEIDERTKAGHKVTVHPYALRQDPQDVPLAARRQILDAAIASWRKKRHSS